MDLRDDSSNDSSNDTERKYVQIVESEFLNFLENTRWDWEEVNPNNTRELVFETYDILGWDHLSVRVFSSIDEVSGNAREKGADAIRTVIWDNKTGRPVSGRSKTLRIKTWKKNLKDKLISIEQQTAQHIEICRQCGDLMVIRDGEYGKFYGCRSYPECKNTKSK